MVLGSSAERAALTPFGISKTTSGRGDMAGFTMDASQEALFMPIDLAAYFTMTRPGEYRVVVSCRKQFIPKDSTLSSNELRIVVEGQPK